MMSLSGWDGRGPRHHPVQPPPEFRALLEEQRDRKSPERQPLHWFLRSVITTVAMLVGTVIGGWLFLAGILHGQEWNFMGGGGDDSSLTGQGAVLLLLGIGVWLLAGAVPARVLGAPWWSSMLSVPCGVFLTAMVTPILVVINGLGFFREEGFLLAFPITFMVWFLLLNMWFAGTYRRFHFQALLCTFVVVGLMGARIGSTEGFVVWWCLSWLALVMSLYLGEHLAAVGVLRDKRTTMADAE